MISKTKVSSNRSQQRKAKPSSTTHLSNCVALKRQNPRILVRYIMYRSMFGPPAAKPLTLLKMCCEPTVSPNEPQNYMNQQLDRQGHFGLISVVIMAACNCSSTSSCRFLSVLFLRTPFTSIHIDESEISRENTDQMVFAPVT